MLKVTIICWLGNCNIDVINKIGNKTVYVGCITIRSATTVWMLRCSTIIYIHLNELISEMIIADMVVGLSTQSIWNINNPQLFQI